MSLANQSVTTSELKPIKPMFYQNQASESTAILKLISNGNTIILLKEYFVLTHPLTQTNQIQCQFFQDQHKNWHCRYGEYCFELKTGMILVLNDEVWQFELFGAKAQSTGQQIQQQIPFLRFHTSCDEEHINLSIEHLGATTKLGERVHHYPLLLLARQYRQDLHAGFDATSCGWLDVEQLVKMIGIEATVLNVQLYRAKQQIATALPSHTLIERRAGQVRLNSANVEIIRGAKVEI